MLFHFSQAVEGDLFVLTAWCQSQHEGSAEGELTLAPVRPAFRRRSPMPTLKFPVATGPAGVCGTRVAVPAPPSLQGASLTFSVTAHVRWPERKGRLLRLRVGTPVYGRFSLVRGGVLVLMFLTGPIGFLIALLQGGRERRVSVDVPVDVAYDFDPAARTWGPTVIWRRGDPLPDWHPSHRPADGLSAESDIEAAAPDERFDPFAETNE